MHVRAELSGRRLAVALFLVALVPALLATAAVAYQRPELPPGPAAYNPRPLSNDPVLIALQARELQRSSRLSEQALAQTGPTLVAAAFPEPAPTLTLPPRQAPYELSELVQTVPDAFGRVGDAVLVRASIEVPAGAHLVVDSSTTPDVRLASSPVGFTTVISRGGLVDLVGTTERPLRVASWDEAAAANDTEPSDGRSFLLSFGGQMNVTNADVGYLGFGTGTSSGVAWRGGSLDGNVSGVPATGDVTSSVLHDNWFGAYTYEAADMTWRGNTFAGNATYGFDLQDASEGFLVEGNVARGNGRHGFTSAGGSERNIMRDNVSYENAGHGFMIDDGRSEDSDTAEAARVPSNDNQIVDNRAYDNAGSGIEIEGGTGNVVKGNVLERNHVGVRVRNDASVVVADNVVADSRLFGIDVLAGAGEVEVTGNDVSGGWGSVSLGDARMADVGERNSLSGAETPLVIEGTAVRDDPVTTTIGKYFKWNPLLILWSAILGIPVALAAKALVSRVLGRHRYRPLPS